MCQPEQPQRYVSVANRTICKEKYLLKTGVFQLSRGRVLKHFPWTPFKLALFAVQPPTLKLLTASEKPNKEA